MKVTANKVAYSQPIVSKTQRCVKVVGSNRIIFWLDQGCPTHWSWLTGWEGSQVDCRVITEENKTTIFFLTPIHSHQTSSAWLTLNMTCLWVDDANSLCCRCRHTFTASHNSHSNNFYQWEQAEPVRQGEATFSKYGWNLPHECVPAAVKSSLCF